MRAIVAKKITTTPHWYATHIRSASDMTPMPSLFTYTIPFDDGAAPNPFNGMCTLAICKPAIRRTALVGDWVAGLGSTDAPSGDLSKHLVYAMRVDEVKTLKEYDRLAPTRWPHRVPKIQSPALADRLGDCIYDYSSGSAQQRRGVHGLGNMKTDLDGHNVLISRHFYYFGREAICMPPFLQNICHQTQGHKRPANKPYVQKFIDWIGQLPEGPGQHGWPDMALQWDTNGTCSPCTAREIDGACDIECC